MEKPKGMRLVVWLLGIGLLILVTIVVAVILLMTNGGAGFAEEEQWLHLRTSSLMADAPGNEGMLMDPADMPPLTSEVSLAIHDAASDPYIAGIYLEITGLQIGWAQTQEIRDSLITFVDTGKPCVVWSRQYTNLEYYLATACSDIRLPPAGTMMVHGLALSQTYYADTLAAMNIHANFEHVGDFKSAVEPYERTGPSQPAEAATNALLTSLYDQLILGIAQGRGISTQAAQSLIDDPPMTPLSAQERGMIDGLAYEDEVLDEVGEEHTDMTEYLRDKRKDWTREDDTIAVIYTEGTIVDGESTVTMFGSKFIGDITVSQQLQDVREDPNVKAVVLRVNSPGGSGSASDIIWHEVALTREEKPVVVSMGDYAASGGYYISMGANLIFAQPATLTGSIGVFGGKLNLSGFYEEWMKLSFYQYKRGEFANMFSATSDFSEEERVKFRDYLENFYVTFVTKASEGRSMSYDDMHGVAQGRVWTGEQALTHGLIDELGDTNDAIRAAAGLAEISNYQILRIPERKGLVDQLLDELANPQSASVAVPEIFTPALETTFGLHRVLNGHNSVATMMPYTLQIQ